MRAGGRGSTEQHRGWDMTGEQVRRGMRRGAVAGGKVGDTGHGKERRLRTERGSAGRRGAISQDWHKAALHGRKLQRLQRRGRRGSAASSSTEQRGVGEPSKADVGWAWARTVAGDREKVDWIDQQEGEGGGRSIARSGKPSNAAGSECRAVQ